MSVHSDASVSVYINNVCIKCNASNVANWANCPGLCYPWPGGGWRLLATLCCSRRDVCTFIWDTAAALILSTVWGGAGGGAEEGKCKLAINILHNSILHFFILHTGADWDTADTQ